jgi:hypothetical protein
MKYAWGGEQPKHSSGEIDAAEGTIESKSRRPTGDSPREQTLVPPPRPVRCARELQGYFILGLVDRDRVVG